MSVDRSEKLRAIRRAGAHRPRLAAAVVTLSLLTALLEGVGVGFLLPIIEFTQSSTGPQAADGILGLFVQAYSLVGIPFRFETLIAGITAVLALRFGVSFVVGWLRAVLDTGYQRTLRQQLFEGLLYGPIGYIDDEGSDDLLNSLITEANRAGSIVSVLVNIVEASLRGLIYLALAALISPVLTVVAVAGLGASTLFVRFVLEPAYTVGDEVAAANNDLQSLSQAGIQGMRDVRLFNLRTDLLDRMDTALGEFVRAGVKLKRNQAALRNLNQFTNAVVMFGLVYVGFTFADLSFAEVGVFLLAVFRLSPTVTQLNNLAYTLNGNLPHLVRVQSRIEMLASSARDEGGDRTVSSVDRVSFDDVSFAYDDEDPVLADVSLEIERGQHIALVGQSGAGKSTVVALLGRLQTPDSGTIRADGTAIDEFDVASWRDRIAVVRQQPYIFDRTLAENVAVGDADASRAEIQRACDIAQVTEFLDDLPAGYDTELGEDGVRLSGGQRQRVALARAVLSDADVLLLDEATSDLDSTIEQDVYDRIVAADADRAILSIAHRLSTVSDADRIYALADGRVAETGTHEELVDIGGTYATLYATQSGQPG
jgi:subfamily B ATP-binding cassette protein MsbA